MTTTATCICPADHCIGVPGDSDECAACLALDPEANCLNLGGVTLPSWWGAGS